MAGFLDALAHEKVAFALPTLKMPRPGGILLPRLGAGKATAGANPFSGNKIKPPAAS